MKIGVFFGGESCEHEISVLTAQRAISVLNEKYEVYPIYLDKKNKAYLLNKLFDAHNISMKEEIVFCPKGFIYKKRIISLDVAVLCLHGGLGEGGVIAGIMEMYDIPYTSSNHTTSAILQDKDFTKRILNYEKIKTIMNDNSYPCIIKPANLGSSIGIKVVHNEEEYQKGILDALKYDQKIVVEKYLENCKEYNVAVLFKGDYITSKIEEVLKGDDILSFEDKYLGQSFKSKRIIPAKISIELNNEINDVAIKACRALNTKGVVRIDFLYNGELYLNEINNIPGSLSYYLWDYSYLELLEMLIKEAIRTNQEQRRLVSSYDLNILNIKGVKK